MITYKQLSLAEFFEDCQNKFDNNKYQFLSLLDETINLDEIVLVSFVPDASKFTRFKQDFLMDFSTFTRILYVSSHSVEPRSTPG